MIPPPQEYIINELLLKRITAIMYQDCEPDVDIVDSLIAEVHSRPHPAPARTAEHMQSAYAHGVMDGERKAREDVLKDIQEKQKKKWTLGCVLR